MKRFQNYEKISAFVSIPKIDVDQKAKTAKKEV